MRQLEPDDLAELVVQTVETALGPVLQRMAAAEARLSMLGDVRDRVVAIETKGEQPTRWVAHQDVEESRRVVVDELVAKFERGLAPALEGVTAVRDRVVALEAKAAAAPPAITSSEVVMSVEQAVKAVRQWAEGEFATLREKAAAPVVVDVAKDVESAVSSLKTMIGSVELAVGELRSRMGALDGRLGDLPSTKDYAELRERVAVAETFSRQPGPVGPVGPQGPAGKDGRDGIAGKDGAKGLDGKDGLVGPAGHVGQIGPTGSVGPAGKDGLNGKDGQDGLGFEDLQAEFDGDRTLVLKFARGSTKKTFPIVLPFLRYQGVFVEGKQYTEGDVVTFGGSSWTCVMPTTAKPETTAGAKAWTLCVKRGRDGRDGKDAPSLPVVSIGGGAGGAGGVSSR